MESPRILEAENRITRSHFGGTAYLAGRGTIAIRVPSLHSSPPGMADNPPRHFRGVSSLASSTASAGFSGSGAHVSQGWGGGAAISRGFPEDPWGPWGPE